MNFGVDTRLGAQIRSGLKNILPYPKDSSMQARLTGAISRWLTATPLTEIQAEKDILCLCGFQFNNKGMVNSKWTGIWQFSEPSAEELLLNIPSFIPMETAYAPA